MMNEREKMTMGELYDPLDSELVEARLRARTLLAEYNSTPNPARRDAILRALFKQSGTNFQFETPFHCDYGFNISIGDNVYANVGCIFLDGAPITIGNQVLFGPHVQLFAEGHPLEWQLRKQELELCGAITIGDLVWIGGNTVVCPGVTIGEQTVIGAGSVVTKDVPAGVLAVGNPARVIRDLAAKELANNKPHP